MIKLANLFDSVNTLPVTCKMCGAEIGDTKRHLKWHRKLAEGEING